MIFQEDSKNIIKLLIFFGQRKEDDKNDLVEARQNLDGSGKDQDKLQSFSVVGQLFICREESNGKRIEREIIREYEV